MRSTFRATLATAPTTAEKAPNEPPAAASESTARAAPPAARAAPIRMDRRLSDTINSISSRVEKRKGETQTRLAFGGFRLCGLTRAPEPRALRWA